MKRYHSKIFGETVYVSFRTLIGHDRFGDEIWDYVEEVQEENPDTWGDLFHQTWSGDTAQTDDISPMQGMVQVDNVLINPSTTTSTARGQYDRYVEGHPERIESDLFLYFPRGWNHDMRGARIYVRGVRYDVVGDPERYTDANIPVHCDWNMVVRVVRFDG